MIEARRIVARQDTSGSLERGARSFTALVCTCLLVAGCGGVPDNPPARCEGLVCTVELDDGAALRTVVDATADDLWVYFDFETAGLAEVDDPTTSNAWDLGFQRVVIKSNGGINGNGNVQVAIVEDVEFEDITHGPFEGFQSDEEGGGNIRDPGGTVFNSESWYEYDFFEHTLQPLDRLYVVRTVEGSLFKMRIDAYYDADGASGHPSFTWAAVAPF